jgi:hypothetical protein
MKIFSQSFSNLEKSDQFRLLKGAIDLMGKRLGSTKSEEVNISLKPKVKDAISFKPKLVDVGGEGRSRTSRTEIETKQAVEIGPAGCLKKR